jgi:hypothetical protein
LLVEKRDTSLLHNIPANTGSHPAFSIMGTRGYFLLELSEQGVKLTTHLHPEPRSRIVELYLHSPMYLLGAVLN